MQIINGQRLLDPLPMLPISAPLCLRAIPLCAARGPLTNARKHREREKAREARHEDETFKPQAGLPCGAKC
jgi:hypothetical protein